MGTFSFPLGPSTAISFPIAIFTPFGSGIGLFPTRDIKSSLPKLAENLPAHALLASRASGHDAARRGQNIDPQASQNLRHFLAVHVDAAARPGNALDARNQRHVAGS